MGPDSEAAVIGFDDSVKTLQGFTRNHDSIESAFSALKTGETGIHLFDAMAAGVEMLSTRRKPTKETPAPGRRVLLILSEALDSGSESRLGEVLRRAQLENVTIFSVGLSTTRSEMQGKPRQNQPVLSEIVDCPRIILSFVLLDQPGQELIGGIGQQNLPMRRNQLALLVP